MSGPTLDGEVAALEAMACGVGLEGVLRAIAVAVERSTGGRCRIAQVDEGAEGGSPDGGGRRGRRVASVSIGGRRAADVVVDGHDLAPPDVAPLVARAALLVGMAIRAARRSSILTHHATHDPLTGLPNRVLLLDRLGHALAAARRREGDVALLYVDLDGFKSVNDELGHAVGDHVLVELAGRLACSVREGDTVARIGGDEFAVLLDETDEATATALAGRIEAALGLAYTVEGRTSAPSVGASVGVAMGVGGVSVEELLKRSDRAMYERKRGRSRPPEV